jgi:large subunit ribosomal protein L29
MDINKIRNLGPEELAHQERDAAEQLFRMKFQMRMGQTAGVKKIRELRRDVARFKTIARERELGIARSVVADTTAAASGSQQSAPEAKAAPKKAAAKSAAPKKAAAKKSSAAGAKTKTKSAAKKK